MDKKTKHQKNCYHCFKIRPNKNNYCVILKKHIEDVHNFVCEDFTLDIVLERIEERDEDPEKQIYKLYFIAEAS
jgi:hypothetical protein